MERQYEPTGKFVVRRIVDECILVPVSPELKQRDTLLVLNETAAKLFEGLKLPYAELEAACLAEFETTAAELRADYEKFLETLVAVEAIRLCP